jgi:hypothetical protein
MHQNQVVEELDLSLLNLATGSSIAPADIGFVIVVYQGTVHVAVPGHVATRVTTPVAQRP